MSSRGASADVSREPTDLLEALAESERRLQCVIELSSDCYWETDEHLRFTLLRRGAGTRRDDHLRVNLGKARWELGGEPVDGSWDEHKAVCRARRPFTDFVVRHRDDRLGERYFSISGQPVFEGNGRFRGYRGLTRNITREKRDARLLELDHKVLRILAGAEDPDEALAAALGEICRSEGWDAGQYWAVDKRKAVMRFHVGWNAPDAAAGEATDRVRKLVIERGRGLVGEVWRTGQSLWVEDLHAEERLLRKDLVRRTGWRSAFLFPVAWRGETIGVLDFNARQLARPDEPLLQVMRSLAAHIGTFHQRAVSLAELRDSEELYSSTVELAAIGISHVAADGRFIHVNRQLCEMLGYTRDELLGLTVKQISHPDDVAVTDEARERLRRGEIDSYKVEKRYLRKDGRPVWVRITVAARRAKDGEPLYDISVVEDISERKRAEERVQYLATHDEMTGLPNRAMFGQLLNHAIESARRALKQLAVLFIDLDRFKIINDSLGHEAGDRLLQEMAARLRGSLRARDVVARLGGDEFVVLLEDIADAKQAARVARKLLSAALQPLEILGQECRVTASIGISIFPADGEDPQSLMKNADVAMYHAKEEGKNNYQFYSKEVNSLSIERLALETNLRRALERNELTLQYQAKVNIRSGEISGVEALLRWWNRDLGAVPPAQFIPLAEDTGLIVPIGRWVLKTACAQAVAWQRAGLPPVRMGVNISPRQFKDPDLLRDVERTLEQTGLEPQLLELEITEGVVMQDVEAAVQKLVALKEMGVRVAIDDFGTGYSSLAQLKRFPIDTLKVDRSFIRDIPSDSEDKAITEAIIAMGKTLGVTVVAEGVETAEQEAFLSSRACHEMQGFYFSKPSHPDVFAELLRSRNRAPARARRRAAAGRRRK